MFHDIIELQNVSETPTVYFANKLQKECDDMSWNALYYRVGDNIINNTNIK